MSVANGNDSFYKPDPCEVQMSALKNKMHVFVYCQSSWAQLQPEQRVLRAASSFKSLLNLTLIDLLLCGDVLLIFPDARLFMWCFLLCLHYSFIKSQCFYYLFVWIVLRVCSVLNPARKITAFLQTLYFYSRIFTPFSLLHILKIT